MAAFLFLLCGVPCAICLDTETAEHTVGKAIVFVLCVLCVRVYFHLLLIATICYFNFRRQIIRGTYYIYPVSFIQGKTCVQIVYNPC